MIRLIEATSSAAPAKLDASDELTSLGSLATDLVRSIVATPGGENDAALAAQLTSKDRLVLVRSLAGEPSFACPVLLTAAAPAVCLDVATLAAEACFSMSASRFTSALPPNATPEAIDAVLAGLAAASDAGPLPPPGIERVLWALRRMFQRTKAARALVSELPLESSYGTVVSRDPRTGAKPVVARVAASVRGLFEPPGRSAVPLAELAALSEAERARLDGLVVELETALERPVRVAFTLEAGRARIVSVEPLRRAGIVAFELSRDLLNREVITRRQALALIEPNDVMLAVEPRLVFDADAAITTGIAAGPGLAEGFVALTPSQAEALHRAGLPSVLVVHEVMPEDIGALRVSAGILTVRGGITGEAAVMARGLAKPCVASGSALSLGSGEVHNVASGGGIRPYERITIDGGTGEIVRGAAVRHLSEVPGAVAELLGVAGASSGLVLACVDHPNHVLTAKRFGATGVVLMQPERVAFELLSLAAAGSFEARLTDRLRQIAEAARTTELGLAIVLPTRGAALPQPIGRPLSAQELDAFGVALAQAVRVAEIEVVVGQGTLPLPANTKSCGLMCEALAPAVDLPGPPRTLYFSSAEATVGAPEAPAARRVLVAARPGGSDLAALVRLAAAGRRSGEPRAAVGFACDPAAVLSTRLLLGQIDP